MESGAGRLAHHLVFPGRQRVGLSARRAGLAGLAEQLPPTPAGTARPRGAEATATGSTVTAITDQRDVTAPTPVPAVTVDCASAPGSSCASGPADADQHPADAAVTTVAAGASGTAWCGLPAEPTSPAGPADADQHPARTAITTGAPLTGDSTISYPALPACPTGPADADQPGVASVTSRAANTAGRSPTACSGAAGSAGSAVPVQHST
ncbi:MAG: hypothetical protein WCB92_21675, partial [Mycobacterium sp.]